MADAARNEASGGEVFRKMKFHTGEKIPHGYLNHADQYYCYTGEI